MTALTYLEGLGTALETDVKDAISGYLVTFVTTDLGKIAVDAVNFAADEVDATSGADKREVAKTQLMNDLEAAGKDLSGFADAFLNFLIETALQAVTAGAATAAAASL